MRINVNAMRELGYMIDEQHDIDGQLERLEIVPERPMSIDWSPMEQQFRRLRVSDEIIERALEKFVDTLHEEEVFDAMREARIKFYD